MLLRHDFSRNRVHNARYNLSEKHQFCFADKFKVERLIETNEVKTKYKIKYDSSIRFFGVCGHVAKFCDGQTILSTNFLILRPLIGRRSEKSPFLSVYLFELQKIRSLITVPNCTLCAVDLLFVFFLLSFCPRFFLSSKRQKFFF